MLWELDKTLMSQPLRGSSLVAWGDGLDIEKFQVLLGTPSQAWLNSGVPHIDS